ncbi:MAG: zf-HC2 domain-containing protein [Pseudomonadota bacterium]
MTNLTKTQEELLDEVRADLPWYVTGALDDARRREIDAHLAASPSLREELAEERRLRESLLARDDFESADEQIWQQLKTVVETPAAPTWPAAPARAPLLERIMEALDTWRLPLAGGGLAFAAIALAMVLAPQLIGLGDGQNQAAPYTTLTTPEEVSGPTLRVKAVDGTEEGALLALFSDLGLEVIGDPSPTGLYLLQPRTEADLGDAAAILSDTPEIAFVVLRTGR